MKSRQFSYTQHEQFPNFQSGLPFLPLTLSCKDTQIETSALTDSGSTVNVLPYNIGLGLGLILLHLHGHRVIMYRSFWVR